MIKKVWTEDKVIRAEEGTNIVYTSKKVCRININSTTQAVGCINHHVGCTTHALGCKNQTVG